MSARNLAHLYRVRLRARWLQECFALVGIAAGVALLFASQVASESLTSSVAELSHGITGRATLQLLARAPQGIPESLLPRVRRLSAVRSAAPLLEASAQASGPKGSASVQLVGAEASLRSLGGALIAHTELEPFAGIGAILLPAPLARHIGVIKFGREATLRLYGRSMTAPLYRQLTGRQIGGLVDSPIVVAPLFYAQELAGLPGRVSRILVQPRPGREAQARADLERLAGSSAAVRSTAYDEQLFAKAAYATNQSTLLFALISALVGFLFAFNAVLLTVPQRRRLIADLRREGYPPSAVLAVLVTDALLLAVAACALGLLLGDELSLHLFRSNPGYLGSAFAVGSQRTVGWQAFVVALAGGILAALAAVLTPLRDLFARDPLAATSGRERALRSSTVAGLSLAGLVALGAATAVLLLAPSAAIAGMVVLVLALLSVLPAVLAGAIRGLERLARLRTGVVGHVAAMELGAARARAVAVAATGAIAVFGAVAIQGAHADLLRGLENAARDENAFTDLWVAPPGAYNLLRTAPFPPGGERRLAALPGVRRVLPYRGGLLDWGTRRVWVIAPSAQAAPLLPASQILEGRLRSAEAALRAGTGVVLSQALASEHHLHIGDLVTLPAPSPLTLRVAAISTNLGWAPGALTISAAAFARGWGPDLAAYNVLLAPGVHAGVVAGEAAAALGSAPGLAVQTAGAHENEQNALSRQGLQRLSEIATLILVIAVLAMASAIANMVWQRRPRLAKLKLEGFPRGELWRTVLLESVLLLAVGCLTGAAFGLYGQQLLDRALANVINFPVVHSVALLPALISLGVVTAAAAVIVAIPGYAAARVPAAVALQD